MKKTEQKRKPFKIILCVLVIAVFTGGGYYVGYNHQTSSILSAIPKQSHEKPGNISPEASIAPDADTAAQKSESDTSKKTPVPTATPDDVKYIGSTDLSPIKDTWSEIDKFECDINGDGQNETITLATSAKKLDGEIMWDDSQNWAVEVKSSSATYELFNKKVSNGNVYFNVDEVSNGTYAITVYVVSSSGTNITQYTYSKNGFVEKQIYSVKSGNNLHSGIPAYE